MNLAHHVRTRIPIAIASLMQFLVTPSTQAQEPQRFTADRVLKFDAGTPKARAMLSRTPEVRDLVAEQFGIAAADLNDDGTAEIVLVSRSSNFCGSGGCALVVLEKKGPRKIVPVLSPYVQGEDLALTKEKVNGYRALAQIDGEGQIELGNREGTPLYRKQLVYVVQAGGSQVAAAAQPAPSGGGDEAKVIAEATGGRMKAKSGEFFDKDCNEKTTYSAEVIDLNGDGQPEVFANLPGICHGGRVGVHMNLYIRNAGGQWKPQFGFPGIYNILNTRNMGYPDIEIGGPGSCAPVWRWNGQQYEIHKMCR